MRVKISRGVFLFQSILIVIICVWALNKCNSNTRTVTEKKYESGHNENQQASNENNFSKSRTYNKSNEQNPVSDEKSKLHLYETVSKSTPRHPLLAEKKSTDPIHEKNNHLETFLHISKPSGDDSDSKISLNTSENGTRSKEETSFSKYNLKKSGSSVKYDKTDRSSSEITRAAVIVSTKDKLNTSKADDSDAFKDKEEFAEKRFKGFQLINDNLTYVYAGYYDDRDGEAQVKVVAVAPQKITYNFTCALHYPGGTVMYVTGHISYLYSSCIPYVVKHIYAFGYIICPLHQKKPLPSFLSIGKQGTPAPKINVTVWAPSKTKNKITRCVKPFIENYDNVLQIVWNVELLRIYGVDKFVFYLDKQTPRVVDILRSYEKDGIVEMRNFTINQPGKPVHKLVKSRLLWAEFLALNDCLLSQMNSAKYVLFIDVDEVIVPRKHKTVLDLAEDLFNKTKFTSEHIGSLLVRNVYFPTYMNITKEDFPQKDLAVKYNIEPLLHTTRMKTSAIGTSPKSLVRPETVDVMCIHQPFSLKNGWFRKIVDEGLATIQHYRSSMNGYMYPPETQDNYLLSMSTQLIPAVEDRLKKAGMLS